jgi:hypothetical protein
MYVPPFIDPFTIRMFSSQIGNFANVVYSLFNPQQQNDIYLLAGAFSYQGNVTSSRVNNDGLVIVTPRYNNATMVMPLLAGGVGTSGNVRYSFPMNARVQPLLVLASEWQIQTNAPLLSGDASAVINIHLWYGRIQPLYDKTPLTYESNSKPFKRGANIAGRSK